MCVCVCIVSAFCMVSKGLEKRLGEIEIKGRSKALQMTALLKSATILIRVLGDPIGLVGFGFMAYQPL